MNRLRNSVLSTAALLLSPAVLFGQSNDDRIRLQYTDENAPPPVVFGLLLRDVFTTSLYPHDGSYSNLKPGASNQTNLEDVFDYLVLLWLEQDKEYGESMMRMLCPQNSSRPRGSDIFLVFDALDDLHHALRQKYYAIAKSELIAKYSFDLDKVIDNYPGGFSEIWLYHEKSYGGSVKGAEEAASHICENGHSSSFVIHESPDK